MLQLLAASTLALAGDPPQPPVQTNGIPNAQMCYGLHRRTGQRVPVRHIVGNAGGYRAYATADNSGYPIIIYSDLYFGVSNTSQRFTAFHECGHHEWATSNEIAANCYALNAMNPTRAQLDHLRDEMYAIPVLEPQYGGSGRAFWDLTMANCSF